LLAVQQMLSCPNLPGAPNLIIHEFHTYANYARGIRHQNPGYHGVLGLITGSRCTLARAIILAKSLAQVLHPILRLLMGEAYLFGPFGVIKCKKLAPPQFR
jgi:hypothetical protein